MGIDYAKEQLPHYRQKLFYAGMDAIKYSSIDKDPEKLRVAQTECIFYKEAIAIILDNIRKHEK